MSLNFLSNILWCIIFLYLTHWKNLNKKNEWPIFYLLLKLGWGFAEIMSIPIMELWRKASLVHHKELLSAFVCIFELLNSHLSNSFTSKGLYKHILIREYETDLRMVGNYRCPQHVGFLPFYKKFEQVIYILELGF